MAARPTLVIALGGTGKNIAFNLRKRLFMEFGDDGFENVRFLYIDSDGENNEARTSFPESWHGLKVATEVMAELTEPKSPISRKLHIDEWLDTELRQNLTGQSFAQGVRGVRGHGRLALLACEGIDRLRRAIQREIQALNRIPDAEMIRIYILSSAGGGTGSGTFIDMGYLVRWIAIEKLNLQSGSDFVCEGIAAIAVPGLVSSPAHTINSAALLSELDHFCGARNIFEACYGDEDFHATERGKAIAREAPYDHIFLVSPIQGTRVLEENPDPAMEKLEQKIADFLFLRLVGPEERAGSQAPRSRPTGEIEARLADMAQNYVEVRTDRKGYPNRFATFGVSLLQFPVALCERWCFVRGTIEFVDTWLNPSWRGMNVGRLDSPDEQYEKDLSELCDLLGLRIQDASSGLRLAQKDGLYRRLVRLVGGNQLSLEDALRQAFKSGREKVDNLFAIPANETAPISPDNPGYVARTVAHWRNHALAREGDSNISVFVAIQTKLLEYTFDRTRGPRYALQLIEDLTEQINKEVDFISKCLDSGPGSAGDLDERIAAVRRDPLLFSIWKDKAVAREIELGGDDFASYTNRKYEHCVIEAKRQILITIRDGLLKSPPGYHDSVDLHKRLSRLVEFVEEWKSKFEKEREQLKTTYLNNLPEGTIWPKVAVEHKYKALFPEISPAESLQELWKKIMEPEFLIEFPRDAEGRKDFSVFEGIEHKILDAFTRQNLQNIRDSIRQESVLRLLSEEGQGGVRDRVQGLVNDSEILLNLRLGDTDYPNSDFKRTRYRWYALVSQGADRDSFDAFQTSVTECCNAAGIQPEERDEGCDHNRPNLVAAVSVRAAFPTRIINQYDSDNRANLFHGEGVAASPFTDCRVKPPIPERDLDEIGNLIILAETLLWKGNKCQELPCVKRPQSRGHELWYTDEYRQPAVVRYPNTSLEAAAEALFRVPSAVRSLRIHFEGMKEDDNNRGVYQEAIGQHIEELCSLRN